MVGLFHMAAKSFIIIQYTIVKLAEIAPMISLEQGIMSVNVRTNCICIVNIYTKGSSVRLMLASVLCKNQLAE